MARTTAPLFSLDASGTIANSIVFSKWRGRQYVRRHAIPKNPRTDAQIGIRAMMKFLAQDYQTWKSEIDAAYALVAAAANVSPFNAWVAYNMRRWRQMRGPTTAYPAGEAAFAVTTTQTLTGGPRNILVGVTPSSGTDMWAIAIFRSLTTITDINWNNCVAILPSTGGTPISFTDGPLTPGTYHYRASALSLGGIIGDPCSDDDATATA